MQASSSLFGVCILLYLTCWGCSTPTADQDYKKHKVLQASITPSPLEPEEERKYSLMEREIEYLLEIWPGEYDNVEQLSLESDAGRKTAEKGQHKRIHSKFIRVHHKDLSEYLLYVEEFQHNDNKDVFRHHVYEFLPVDSNATIRIKVYDFKDGKELWGSEKVEEQIKDMSKSSFIHQENLDLYLYREGHAFMSMTRLLNQNEAQREYQVRISPKDYWFRYKGEQTGREDWYTLDKARCFICMVDFPREPGGRPVETKYYVDMHDQGGQFEFDYTDGRHMVLTMRNTWSYGMQRNTFVIVIQENDLKGPTLIYSWGEEGADRIGMNPGWIRIQCDEKNEKNISFQQKLRSDS